MEYEKPINSAIIKIEEIVEFVNKLGFKIDRTVIESIDSDTIVELYSSIMEKLNIIKKDKLKIRYDGMHIFSYTGLHDRPIYILKLYHSMRNFVKDVLKVEDFSASDLFSPQPKRTKKILTKFMKFHKFKQDEKEFHKIFKDNLDTSINTYKEALAKNEKITKNLAKIQSDRENDKENTEKINSELEILTARKEEINNEITDLQEKISDRNNNLNGLEEKIVYIFNFRKI